MNKWSNDTDIKPKRGEGRKKDDRKRGEDVELVSWPHGHILYY